MNKLPFSPSLVGLSADLAFIDDYVMNTKFVGIPYTTEVPILKKDPKQTQGFIMMGKMTKTLKYFEQLGAQGFVDEDLLISKDLRNNLNFSLTPFKGGYIMSLGVNEKGMETFYVIRKAKPFEFSSIHAFLTREGGIVYNHTFVEKLHYSDFLSQNNLSAWRMPFSPLSPSTLAVSWQLIDPDGGKWECVAPALQKPWYIPRLTHFNLTSTKAASVNVVEGPDPGYDEASHTFTAPPGSQIRLFFINTPMGQKEWSDEVALNLSNNEIIFI